jgi:hypothetical protein
MMVVQLDQRHRATAVRKHQIGLIANASKK